MFEAKEELHRFIILPASHKGVSSFLFNSYICMLCLIKLNPLEKYCILVCYHHALLKFDIDKVYFNRKYSYLFCKLGGKRMLFNAARYLAKFMNESNFYDNNIVSLCFYFIKI